MAECTVSFVINKLDDLLVKESSTLSEVRRDIESIVRDLLQLHCYLRDADAKGETDGGVKKWVREIMEICFQVEDVIDTFIFNSGGSTNITGTDRQQSGDDFFLGQIKRCVLFLSPHMLCQRHEISRDLDDIKMRIKQICNSTASFGINCSSVETGRRRILPAVNTGDDVMNFVGLKKDLEKLENLILQVDPRLVLPIVGIGGLGKTTLAKKLYRSVSRRGYFSCSVWISLSPECSTGEKILQELVIKGMGKEKQDVIDMEVADLERQLFVFLAGRRFLIVLDDVWRMNTESWDYIINSCLPDTRNGSRVIVTSRNYEGIGTGNCFPPYGLQHLNDDDSWELLKKKALFSPTEEDDDEEEQLELVGKQIGRECYGLPLGLVVLGGLLSTRERSPGAWMKVMEEINWKRESSDPQDRCLQILASSYSDLPCYLKWCFLYLTSFPGDSEIETDKLIWLWIAEGFVHKLDDDSDETLEEIGEQFLEELINRGLIQVGSRSSLYGTVETCSIHELLRDLAVSKAMEANFIRVIKQKEEEAAEEEEGADAVGSPPTIRRLSVHNSIDDDDHDSCLSPTVRTVLNFGGSFLDFTGLNLLRVLDLEGISSMTTLPDEVGDMVFLKYLGLSKTGLESLPDSTGNLRHLETLDVRNTGIHQLPDGVWRITTLRHVLGNWLQKPERIGIGRNEQETDLHTLGAVAAGPWIKNNLGRLTNLCRLWVFGYKSDEVYSDLLTEHLRNLHRLRILLLFSTSTSPLPDDLLTAVSALQNLQFLSLRGSLAEDKDCKNLPAGLIKVNLKSTGFMNGPFWSSIQELKFLRILVLNEDSYSDTEMVCVAAGFPQLQELFLDNLKNLENWIIECGAMPCLRHLSISCCLALRRLPIGLENLAALQNLDLKCSASFSNLVWNEEWEKVKHVTVVTINGKVVGRMTSTVTNLVPRDHIRL